MIGSLTLTLTHTHTHSVAGSLIKSHWFGGALQFPRVV